MGWGAQEHTASLKYKEPKDPMTVEKVKAGGLTGRGNHAAWMMHRLIETVEIPGQAKNVNLVIRFLWAFSTVKTCPDVPQIDLRLTLDRPRINT